MPLWEGWVQNWEVRLHYLTNAPVALGELSPLVIVPGTAEAAEDYADLLEALAPRRCLALSLRGRGQSGSPQRGYTLIDHTTDVEALVNALDLPPFCLMGYSRGVAYALAYAARQPARLAGLILGDYPAHHPAMSPEWIAHFLESTCRGIPVSERLMPHVAEGLQREAEDIPLWDYLPGITCPVLILRGGQPGSRLSVEATERYLELLPDARVVRLEDSGHALWEPDYGLYVVTIGGFLERLDAER